MEDDPVTSKWLKSTVEQDGFQGLQAENGKQGIQTFKDNPEIRLIFCDYKMPVLDGKGFMKKLHKLMGKNPVPVILISGEMSFKEYNYLLKYGAKGFMEKPLFASDIQNILNQFLRAPISEESVAS